MSNLFTSFHFSSFWLYSSSRFLDFCVILDVQQGYHLTKNISLIAGIEFFSSIKYTCSIFWCYSISCPLFLNSGQLVEEWFAFAMASWGQLCQRHVCTLRQYFCAHASHLNASFQYFTALATHVKPAFFSFLAGCRAVSCFRLCSLGPTLCSVLSLFHSGTKSACVQTKEYSHSCA